jgi:hypothetical protein
MNLPQLPESEQKKIAAWTICRTVPGRLPQDWRYDDFGNMIYRADHGKQTEYGWEIDHRHPSALGGIDHHSNLRALHWRKNRELGGALGQALNALNNASIPNLFKRG